MSRSQVAMEALGLEPGQSIRITCPFCGGGSDRERCMSIKLDVETGLVLYHCFRGNCTEGSGVLGGGLVRTSLAEKSRWKPYDCTGFLPSTATNRTQVMLETWYIDFTSPYVQDWKYDPDTDRLAMSVYGPVHDLRGYVLRAYDRWTKPKVLSARLTNEAPFQCWLRATGRTASSIIVVEDIPSAVRVAEAGYDAVALLGNTPSDDAMEEIAREANYSKPYRPVVWALDPDATSQAIRLQRSYGLRGASSVLVLYDDFKNMVNEEVAECLQNVP